MDAFNWSRWLPLVAMAVVAVLIGANIFVAGNGGGFDIALLLIMAGIVWWAWPGRRGKHVDHRIAQAEATADDVIIYWRPG